MSCLLLLSATNSLLSKYVGVNATCASIANANLVLTQACYLWIVARGFRCASAIARPQYGPRVGCVSRASRSESAIPQCGLRLRLRWSNHECESEAKRLRSGEGHGDLSHPTKALAGSSRGLTPPIAIGWSMSLSETKTGECSVAPRK